MELLQVLLDVGELILNPAFAARPIAARGKCSIRSLWPDVQKYFHREIVGEVPTNAHEVSCFVKT